MKEGRDLSGFAAGGSAECRWMPGATIGIIGGMGEMGRLFARFFGESGYRVLVSDRNGEYRNREVVEASDLVLFSVPLPQSVEVIRGLIPFVRSDQLLMDLTSLKVGPVREMLNSTAAVLGLHPMFGGRISTFAGQTLVACPVRISEQDWAFLRGLFTRAGIRVKEATPEEHDRMMSIIQVLFHMTTMLNGRVLRELGVDIAETMDYTSPSYRLEINLLGRMFAQSAMLYSAITQMNPYTGEIIRHLRDGLDCFQRWYEEGRLDDFVRDFEASAEHLGEFSSKAFLESSTFLDFVVSCANSNGEAERK